MKPFLPMALTKIAATLNSAKVALGVMSALSGATALAILPGTGFNPASWFEDLAATTPTTTTSVDDHGVKLLVRQSQTKIVSGSPDEVFVDVEIIVPESKEPRLARKPTDLILVLDRSGSMQDAVGTGTKMDYAKAAIQSFTDRLTSDDRIALVSFDDRAIVEFPLSPMTDVAKTRLKGIVATLGPGGGTNIESGLRTGDQIEFIADSRRTRRIILLSDGNANTGISDPEGLASIVKAIATRGSVVSAIGMGIDFNELLLTRLADHGMGNYTYLETLTTLDQALAKDLEDAREQFASASTLQIDLGRGASVSDVAGYPRQSSGQHIAVPLGQLLSGSKRYVTIAVKVPSGSLGRSEIGRFALSYDKQGISYRLAADGGRAFGVEVVSAARSREAIASIDKQVFEKSWITNNVGRVKKEYSEHIRNGNQAKAKETVQAYRQKLAELSANSGISLGNAELENELRDLDAEADDAFVGSAPEQAAKQKSLSKKSWSSGLKDQRPVIKSKP